MSEFSILFPEKPKYPVTSTPYQKKESLSDTQIADSNPECDIEGMFFCKLSTNKSVIKDSKNKKKN